MKPLRAQRGYVLAEALAAGAVLALAVAGLLAGISQAGGFVGRAQMDRAVSHLAQAELERLRALPLSSAAWTPGPATACLGTPPEGWTCSVQVSAVTDSAVGLTPALTYRRARVTVSNTFRGLTWSLDALR